MYVWFGMYKAGQWAKGVYARALFLMFFFCGCTVLNEEKTGQKEGKNMLEIGEGRSTKNKQ